MIARRTCYGPSATYQTVCPILFIRNRSASSVGKRRSVRGDAIRATDRLAPVHGGAQFWGR